MMIPSEAHAKLLSESPTSAFTVQTVRNWFRKFKIGNFSVKDRHRSGRPKVIDYRRLRTLVENNPNQTTRTLAQTFHCTNSTIYLALKAIGYKSLHGYIVPHIMSQETRQRRIEVCQENLDLYRGDDWLNDIVTSDEKYVLYENFTRHRQWVQSADRILPFVKATLFPKKIMLCAFWGAHGIYLDEILNVSQTVNAELYCRQLSHLKMKLDGLHASHRPRQVVYLHDNAPLHRASKTIHWFQRSEWHVLRHSSYSPDLAPFDYFLFRHLQNYLKVSSFTLLDDLVNFVRAFLGKLKSRTFYARAFAN